MATFRNGAYDALIETLIAQRKSKKGMTLRKMAKLLPEWLGFDWSTLHKIEKKRRDLSFVEGQELAKVLDTTVGELDAKAKEIAAARSNHVRQPAAPRRRPNPPNRKGGTARQGGA
jgi:hypothetical protein